VARPGKIDPTRPLDKPGVAARMGAALPPATDLDVDKGRLFRHERHRLSMAAGAWAVLGGFAEVLTPMTLPMTLAAGKDVSLFLREGERV
jgi:hypothetical protein